MLIESKNNLKYKTWLKLKTTRGRKKEGAFIIEGHKLLADALLSGIHIESIIIDEKDAESTVEKLLSNIEGRRKMADFSSFDKRSLEDPFILKSKLFRDLSEMENSDGILAVSYGELEKSFRSGFDDKRVLILDRIRDPGNMGTLLRSAEAFNFKTVICLDSCDVSNYKVLRASMGSAFRLDIIKIGDSDGLGDLDQWKEESACQWYGGDMDGPDFRNMEACDKMALIIGNEGGGLSEWFLQRLDTKVKIPMQGRVESLNAAVSGSILMARFALP